MKGEKQVLFVDKSKLGKLVQFSSLKEGEDESKANDIFYMNIQSFSEDQGLLNEFMHENTPEWLKGIGDEQQQEEYLLERVRIQIFESFEYKKEHDENIGYKILLN